VHNICKKVFTFIHRCIQLYKLAQLSKYRTRRKSDGRVHSRLQKKGVGRFIVFMETGR